VAVGTVEPSVAASVRARRLTLGPIAIASGVLLAAALAGILVGAIALPAGGILAELVDALPFVDVDSGLTERQATILWELRLPRVVLGGLVGAALAMSGAAYQGVFRNPLADPYLLGVAAGAGLGATVALAYLPGATTWPVDPLPLAAFVGGLAGVVLTYALGRSGTRTRTTATLILAGVAVAAFLTALQTFVQQRHSDTLREVYSWILGTLGTVGWGEVSLIVGYVVVGGAVLVLHRRLLDVMALGDEEADSVGIRAGRVRIFVVVAATLATAGAVAVSGLIGFVGIIVPHTVRLVFGTSYRLVLPLSIMFGAAFLIVADLLARTLAAPAEIPVGVVTAFVGAPFFLLVLRRARRIQ
jgi:iron complex transport system permease protein